jgi:hypothetical protein
MRKFVPIVLMAVVAGCTAPPPRSPMVDQKAQARLAQLLHGKVAGEPQSCLPSYSANDMVVIDDYTIGFREGTRRVWINKPAGGCNLLSAGPYALLTRNVASSGTCRGDIAHVVDTMSGMTVGSCVFGDFVPYTTPGR